MMRIEATYLCKELPKNFANLRHEKIEQGYLSNRSDPARFRKKGSAHSITRKIIVTPKDYSFRDYVSVEIYKEEFEKIWPLMIKTLKKTRYYFNQEMGAPEIRIDVFEDDLKGLVLIELIFESESDMRDFQKPEWFGAEITDTSELTNPAIAGKKYKDIEPMIKKCSLSL